MKVLALGLRGLPNVQGGIETHVEQLYPRLAARGVDVTVVARAPYARSGEYKGVKVVSLPSPKRQGVEAFVHTLMGVLYAAYVRPDVLHLHAVGPGLFAPLARLLGLRVVFTHHGEDYHREKWGVVAKQILRWGEYCASRFSHETIAISEPICSSIARHGRVAHLIPNGVPPTESLGNEGTSVLEELGLSRGHYVLSVARLVPEKRQLDLIAAFRMASAAAGFEWQLALVGAGTAGDPYVEEVARAAGGSEQVKLAGFRTGAELQTLFANCGVFCLPSSHEGHPIALLEALAHGAPLLASDIPANRQIGLPRGCYVPVGDTNAWAAALLQVKRSPEGFCPPDSEALIARYDWERIADRTLEVLSAAAAA